MALPCPALGMLSSRLAALYGRINAHYRPRRMRRFLDEFRISDRTRILDLGGSPFIWSYTAVKPRITLVNLQPEQDFADVLQPNMRYCQGSALDVPFQAGEFDVIFSNSVIEHVGDAAAQQRFANEVRRFGAPYYVQTPNRSFPVEPHVIGPGIQWMPRGVARIATRHLSVWGLTQRPAWSVIDAVLDDIRLLRADEMARLFPDALIWHERVIGVSKSISAVRLPPL